MSEYFTFDGRVRRMTVWINVLITIVAYVIMSGILAGFDNAVGIGLVLLIYLVLFIRGLSVSVRRWHDLNKSGAWVFISLVPIVGAIYALIMQGFMPGDEGANTYGPAPEAGQFV